MTYLFSSDLLKSRLGGRNLYLVGMMGAGKSCTGPYLAKQLSYSFVDSDQIIEESCGQPISHIFKEDGEEAFRDVESQVLNVIGQRHSLVVGTGGGLVTRPENWGVLHQGIVIWIDPGLNRLFSRLKTDSGNRPLLNKHDSFEAFESLLTQREKYYVEADLHVKVGDEGPEEVANLILRDLPAILKEEEGPSAPQTTAK